MIAMPFILKKDYVYARAQSDLISSVQGYVNDTALKNANVIAARLAPGQTIAGIKHEDMIAASQYMNRNGSFSSVNTAASTVYSHQEGKVMYAAFSADGLNCCIPFMNSRFQAAEEISKVWNCTTLIEGPSVVALSVVTRRIHEHASRISNDPHTLCRSLVYPQLQSRRGLNTFENCSSSKHQDIYDCEIGHVEIDYPCDQQGKPEGIAVAEVRNRSTAEVIARYRINYNI